MKKILSFVLALVMCLGLCACAEENNTQTDTQEGIIATEDISEQLTTEEQKTTEIPKTGDSPASSDSTITPETPTTTTKAPTTTTKAPTTTTKAPTTTTKPVHTHSFSAATCTTPKKCSCGATEGSTVNHVVEGTTCKWCKQVVVVSPNGFNPNVQYAFISDRVYESDIDSGLPDDKYKKYLITVMDFRKNYLSTSHAVYWDPSAEPDPILGTMDYNGVTYHYIGMYGYGFEGVTTYQITESEIKVSFHSPYNTVLLAEASFQLLSNGALRMTSLSFDPDVRSIPEYTGLRVSAIFYPQ